jgi:hypothetical protein
VKGATITVSSGVYHTSFAGRMLTSPGVFRFADPDDFAIELAYDAQVDGPLDASEQIRRLTSFGVDVRGSYRTPGAIGNCGPVAAAEVLFSNASRFEEVRRGAVAKMRARSEDHPFAPCDIQFYNLPPVSCSTFEEMCDMFELDGAWAETPFWQGVADWRQRPVVLVLHNNGNSFVQRAIVGEQYDAEPIVLFYLNRNHYQSHVEWENQLPPGILDPHHVKDDLAENDHWPLLHPDAERPATPAGPVADAGHSTASSEHSSDSESVPMRRRTQRQKRQIKCKLEQQAWSWLVHWIDLVRMFACRRVPEVQSSRRSSHQVLQRAHAGGHYEQRRPI